MIHINNISCIKTRNIYFFNDEHPKNIWHILPTLEVFKLYKFNCSNDEHL
jgi:hypothetical protein